MTREELVELVARTIAISQNPSTPSAYRAYQSDWTRDATSVLDVLADAGVLVSSGQPAEKKRCCIGPFPDGAHALNCTDVCQDCGGAVDGPRRCRCAD